MEARFSGVTGQEYTIVVLKMFGYNYKKELCMDKKKGAKELDAFKKSNRKNETPEQSKEKFNEYMKDSPKKK